MVKLFRLGVLSLVFVLACGSAKPDDTPNVDSGAAADTSTGAGGASVSGTGGSVSAGGAGAGGSVASSGGAGAGQGGSGGMGTVAGTGGSPASGSGGTDGGTGPDASGVPDLRPDVKPASDTESADASYPACRDPDKQATQVPCARLDQYMRPEWQRKGGYRCAVCTWNRPTGVEQQSGCLKPVPQIPGQDNTSILCVMTCNECAF